MKLIGGLVNYDELSSSLHLPYIIRAPLGLEIGASIYFFPEINATGTNKSQFGTNIFLSPIKLNYWGSLHKIHVVFNRDQPGLVYNLIKYIEESNINVILEDSFTTTIDMEHEVTLIVDVSQYRGNLSNKLGGIQKRFNSLRKAKDLNKSVKVNAKCELMNFLRRAWRKLPQDIKEGKKIEDYQEVIQKKGEITIPRRLLKGIKGNKAIVFCNTEEKYINIMLLHEDVESCWLDVIHTQEKGGIEYITEVLHKLNCNILASYNRLERMKRSAHFNVILDISKMAIEVKKGHAVNSLRRILFEGRKDIILDVLQKEYDVEKGETISKPIELGLVLLSEA